METHVKVIGWLYILLGILGVLGAALLFVVVAGSGLISGDELAIQITTLVGFVVGGFLIMLSVPGIIVGIGLLQFRAWARILGIVIGLLNLLLIPIGTALGIYTIWALLDQGTTELFSPSVS